MPGAVHLLLPPHTNQHSPSTRVDDFTFLQLHPFKLGIAALPSAVASLGKIPRGRDVKIVLLRTKPAASIIANLTAIASSKLFFVGAQHWL